jgi:biopolymer transport protein TolQ
MNPELAPAHPIAPLGTEGAASAVDAVAAAGPQIDLSAFALFLHADPVVKGVMVLLLLASIWCWAVILDKAFRLFALRRDAKAFEEGAQAGGLSAERPLASELLAAAAREWRETRRTGATAENAQLLMDRVDRLMQAQVAREMQRASRSLGVLATVGASAPFIGLFGTVWGIMNAFTNNAQQQQTNLAVVAPGIAEALFATALGLVAAIPAVIFYNKFTGDLDRFGDRLDTFSDEVAARLSRRLGERS